MLKFSLIVAVFLFVTSANGSYSGPFLMWGPDSLKDVKLSALEFVDEKVLSKLYGDTKAVVIFLRNGTQRLDGENFPQLKELISKNSWIYLPQHKLPIEPADNNMNVEVISLVGPVIQQDIELSGLYRDTVNIYGQGNVLGILANHLDEHNVFKRAAENISSTVSPTDEPMQENFVYIAEGNKAILYTTSPPVLVTESNVIQELKVHGIVIFDERDQQSRLIVTFKAKNGGKLTLRFRFTVIGGYWSLTSVEVEDLDFFDILTVVGDPPTAPVGFSHKCSRTLVFRNGTNSLTLENVQVQPLLGGASGFSDAFDCIGFTTAPIWSGIFVTSLLTLVLFVGIIALLDIKAPNRFESNRNKQLTFTVQE